MDAAKPTRVSRPVAPPALSATRDLLRIGQLAERAGVSADTIRHYDRLGLLPRTSRTAAGYRLFSPAVVQRVSLIRDAVGVGFSLHELAAFLQEREAGGAPCHDVRATAARILDALDTQIGELTTRRDALRAMLDDWDHRLAETAPHQPAHLLDALTVEAAGSARRKIANLKRRR
jgi:DNA-binding transcriptional MerR regulator